MEQVFAEERKAGRTQLVEAKALVRALGAQVAQGLQVRGVPTSEATAAVARELDIPLLALEEAGTLAAIDFVELV